MNLCCCKPWVVSVRLLVLAGVYAVGVSDLANAAELVASDGAVNDHFGTSVGISGGVGIASGSRSGPTYLFRGLGLAGGNANEDAALWASDIDSFDQFGTSVGLSNGIGLAGAPLHALRGERRGATFVFSGLGTAAGIVNRSAVLVASDGATRDDFGRSVSLSGTMGLVGANLDDDNGSDSGSAYVFRNLDTATGTVSESAKLLASDGTFSDWFGNTTSLSGTLGMVGAPLDDVGANASGSVYVFRVLDVATGTITENAKLLASNAWHGHHFGGAISLSGTMGLIGAEGDSPRGFDSGSAYIFRDLDTAAGTVYEDAYLVASDGSLNDHFGIAVGLSGTTGIVGAKYDGDKGRFSGSAYLFLGLDTAVGRVNESVKVVASGGMEEDWFGASVAIDGDGFLIGAPRAPDPAATAGKVYSGSVSSMTTLDVGNTSRVISGLSFVSREDWVIGGKTDGNRVMLSAGDVAEVAFSDSVVSIGRDAGADVNVLGIAGTLVANEVRIGLAWGNLGNELRLMGTADISGLEEILLAAWNGLSLEGDFTGDGALVDYLDGTRLLVDDGMAVTAVTALNMVSLLTMGFSGGYTTFRAVPEPSVAGMGLLGALAMMRRRRGMCAGGPGSAGMAVERSLS